MQAGELIRFLEEWIPPEKAESWDNSGLQAGRRNKTVKRVYLALDATDIVLEHAVSFGADFLLTHHPLLIEGIKKVNEDDFHGRKILLMAEKGITHYAMHTNYDVCVMGELCGSVLSLTDTEVLEATCIGENGEEQGIGVAGRLPETMSAVRCCEYVKQRFGLEAVSLFGDPQAEVSRVAVCPGSGSSLMHAAFAKKADMYITGDIGHHTGLDGIDQGMLVMDAGHYGLEHVFIGQMKKYLEEHFPDLEIGCEPVAFPYRVI